MHTEKVQEGGVFLLVSPTDGTKVVGLRRKGTAVLHGISAQSIVHRTTKFTARIRSLHFGSAEIAREIRGHNSVHHSSQITVWNRFLTYCFWFKCLYNRVYWTALIVTSLWLAGTARSCWRSSTGCSNHCSISNRDRHDHIGVSRQAGQGTSVPLRLGWLCGLVESA